MPFVIQDSRTAVSNKLYYWEGFQFTLDKDKAIIFPNFIAASKTASKLRNKGLRPRIIEV